MTDTNEERDEGIDRRRLLQASGAGLAASLAGCSGGGDGGDGGGGDGSGGDGGDGGGGGGDGGTQEIHLLTDYTSKAWQDRWENEVVPGFTDEHSGVSVNLEYTGMQGNAIQRLTTLLQSGDAPNSFQSTGDPMAPMHIQGQTAPATDVADWLAEQYGEVKFRSILEWDGETWAIPHGLYAEQTWTYRTDIYDQLSLSVPEDNGEDWNDWNWDTLLNQVEAIDNDSDIEARGIGLAGGKAGKGGTDFEILLATTDARLLQWKDEPGGAAEVMFPQENVVETLSFMEQLAEYSIDPSSISWGEALSFWAGGRMGTQLMLNAWPGGVAASAGNDEVAQNTQIARPALYPDLSSEPADRGFMKVDNATLFDTDGLAETKEFFKYLYRSKDSVIKNHAMEPTRFIPAYPGIMDQEQYQNIEILSKYDGHLHELNKKSAEIGEKYFVSDARVQDLQYMYLDRFPIINEMVNGVLIQGKNKTDAYQEAREKIEDRLAEVQERLGIDQ